MWGRFSICGGFAIRLASRIGIWKRSRLPIGRTMQSSPTLLVAVAAVILFAQIQCNALCASDLCGARFGQTESAPPCHQHHGNSHHNAPGKCSFDLTIAAVTATHFEMPLSSAAGTAANRSPVPTASAETWLPHLSDPSPPLLDRFPAVLRI
jgi:hypothetical protein